MSRIDDLLIAPGATTSDRLWCYGTAALGAALALILAAGEGWPWWTIAAVTVIAFDLYGGAVVNATAAAKRKFHAPGRSPRHHLTFVAAHVQPFIMAWLVPGYTWMTAVATYIIAVAGAALVLKAHLPAAFAITILALTLVPSPDALFWFTPVLLIKLLLSYLSPP